MSQTFHLLGVSEATGSFGDAKLTSLGGYPKFISQGLNENYLPVWMQAAGYNTYYTGKLFNDHNITMIHRIRRDSPKTTFSWTHLRIPSTIRFTRKTRKRHAN
jgi:hypothetical protein